MNIGIHQGNGEVYCGEGTRGYVLSAEILISPCRVLTDKRDIGAGSSNAMSYPAMIFREDFFDSKSRVRRGRIYQAWESQPHTWQARNGAVYGSCHTYSSHSIWSRFVREGHLDVYISLGDDDRYSVWRLIDLEVNVFKEEVITISGLSSYGLLPELLESEIDEKELPLIQERMRAVVEEMYTASVESVVDCCREAAVAVVGAYLKLPATDLARLAGTLRESELNVAANCATTLALFHSRRKTSEIRGRGVRRLVEEDAQFAVSCLGTIVVEIGFGRW